MFKSKALSASVFSLFAIWQSRVSALIHIGQNTYGYSPASRWPFWPHLKVSATGVHIPFIYVVIATWMGFSGVCHVAWIRWLGCVYLRTRIGRKLRQAIDGLIRKWTLKNPIIPHTKPTFFTYLTCAELLCIRPNYKKEWYSEQMLYPRRGIFHYVLYDR